MAQYEIILRNPNGTSDENPTTAPGFNGKPITSGGMKSAIRGISAYGFAKNLVYTVAQHDTNTINIRTGHHELQQKYQFQWQMLQQGVSFLETVGAGLYLGGLPGAMVGAVAGATLQAVNFSNRMIDIGNAKQLENVAISLANVRAGFGNQRSGNNY